MGQKKKERKDKFESHCGSHSVLNIYIFIIKEKCSTEKSRGRETLLTEFKEQILYKPFFFTPPGHLNLSVNFALISPPKVGQHDKTETTGLDHYSFSPSVTAVVSVVHSKCCFY